MKIPMKKAISKNDPFPVIVIPLIGDRFSDGISFGII
jgi:hypothetical protein